MEKSPEVNKDYAIEVLAKKCIHDHRYPMVKVCLPPQKLFFAATNDSEKAFIKKHQDEFVSILEHQRVEKRSNRAQAVWIVDKGIAKVTKVVKNLLKYFGYQNKEGVFLYPEEMLYLLETNRLEVTFADSSLSVEEAYRQVLKTPDGNLAKYRVYKKLANLGYKLTRVEQKVKNIEEKRTLEDADDCENLKIKKLKPMIIGENAEIGASVSSQKNTFMPNEAKYILNVFEKLRRNMPRSCANKIKITNPDYCIWSPTNILKSEPDYNLFICEGSIINKKNLNTNTPNIYAICIDDVSFYRFGDVHLPYI